MSQQLTNLPTSLPTKLRWYLPPDHRESFIENIPSKGLRKFARNLPQIMEQNGISYQRRVLTEPEYQEWLVPYKRYMESKNYDILAQEKWFSSKTEQGYTVEAFFFYQNQELVGSEIFSHKDSVFVSSAYRYSRPDVTFTAKQGSLGAAIDLTFFNEMISDGYVQISRGRSRNAFGIINTMGNLIYKLRFGMTIKGDDTTPESTTIPLSETKSTVFFTFPDSLPLAFIHELPSDPIDPELFRYLDEQRIVRY